MAPQSYNNTIDTIYPDGFERERLFRSSGDMLSATGPVGPGIFARVWERLAHWPMKRAGRLVLRDLTDDQLNDIGLTRWDIRAELERSAFIK
ncbi:DUF1127 domain-containing protein [Rhizobium sp. Leaf371]|uniref:DUF1127 domain-containing protein n=1 Tax=Rhizobium sp. Leaf371 TaxID=1736355 RepID=UPI000AE7EF76|nr:DUF1127 domain-containing protein [Rhizobium sp. Leaf371]